MWEILSGNVTSFREQRIHEGQTELNQCRIWPFLMAIFFFGLRLDVCHAAFLVECYCRVEGRGWNVFLMAFRTPARRNCWRLGDTHNYRIVVHLYAHSNLPELERAYNKVRVSLGQCRLSAKRFGWYDILCMFSCCLSLSPSSIHRYPFVFHYISFLFW